MQSAFKSEIRKLLSVRSTYVIFFLILVIIAIFGFYIEGYRGATGSAASTANEFALREVVLNAATTGSIFLAVIAILFMAHEYRHNMIMYTLTASNSRSKVLAAKILAIICFGFVFTLACALFGVLCYTIGLALRSVTLPGQTFDILNIAGRVLFYNLFYTLVALLLAVLTRNIAAALVLLLVTPSTIEPLLSLLLKGNAGYLPFSALEKAVLIHGDAASFSGNLSSAASYVVVSVYVIGGWLIAWWLFLRRDAN